MRKRTIALAAFLLTGTLFTACGSESNVETVTSEQPLPSDQVPLQARQE